MMHHHINIEQELNSLFNYYPSELIEAALLPLLAKETDYYINEPMNITHVFYAELNEIIQRSLNVYQELGRFDENLKNVNAAVNLLKTLIPIAYVFCKNPSHPYANLTIVLKQEEYKPFDEIKTALNFVLISYPKTNCTVHAFCTISDLIKKGNFYYSVVRLAENCLYQSTKNYNFITATACLEPQITQIQTTFKQYIAKADNFLEVAQNFNESNKKTMAIFMLQQACEFAYRSLVMVFKGTDIKSHDLIVLRKHVAIYDQTVTGLFHKKHKKETRLLTLLNEAYTEARYNFNYKVNDKDLSLIFDCAADLNKGIEKFFKSYLAKYELEV